MLIAACSMGHALSLFRDGRPTHHDVGEPLIVVSPTVRVRPTGWDVRYEDRYFSRSRHSRTWKRHRKTQYH
jgi:hypothetical protein